MGNLRRLRNLGCLAAAALVGASSVCGASVALLRSGDKVDVVVDGQPFTTYYFGGETAKPYLMPLRTPSGAIVTRGFPVVNDVSTGNPKGASFEPHQRPLYFGHGDMDGLDFWQESVFDKYYTDHGHQAYGHMLLKNLEKSEAGGDAPMIRARFTLNSPNNRVIGEETQSFSFGGDSQTRTIDCEFILYATNGPLDIGDTKEGTFAIRLAPELSGPHALMVNSSGAVGEKAIWGKPADWVSYSGTLAGKPVSVTVFDSPKSFRHPTTWHARAYGLFAANPFGVREFTSDRERDGSRAIPEGKSLTFRYRVMIREGNFDALQISDAYRQYAGGQ